MILKACAQGSHGTRKVHGEQALGDWKLQPSARIYALAHRQLVQNAPAQGETMVEQAVEAHFQLQQENFKHLLGITSEVKPVER